MFLFCIEGAQNAATMVSDYTLHLVKVYYL